MSYTRYRTFDLTAYKKAGLSTVSVQPYDTSNPPQPVGVSTPLPALESGGTVYGALVPIPDAHVGSLRYTSGDGSPVVYWEELNPGADEYSDQAVSAVPADVWAATAVSGLSFGTVFVAMAAPMLGNGVDAEDHTTTTWYDVGDAGNSSPRVTSTQTDTARTVTLH